MTEVLLVCGRDGCFERCKATGHASFAAKGYDIVCAAESVLLRTAVDVLQNTGGLDVQSDSSVRGAFGFSVRVTGGSSADFALAERLRCVADFIRSGIKGLESEFPENVHLQEIIE